MIINNLVFKERKLTLGQNGPAHKLSLDAHKSFIMPEPENMNDKMFNCEIKLEVIFKDETNHEVLSALTSYLVIIQLEDNEQYKKETGELIYEKIRPIYIKDINDLLKEINMPGIPYNIKI